MQKRPDIQRLIKFQKLLIDFRNVQRALRIPPENKIAENDAEHSYFLAMFALYLTPFFEELDQAKTLKLALAHDLVEVFAGDTFAFAPETILAHKEHSEKLAAERLSVDWPDFPEMKTLIEEYKTCDSAEAKFIYALDKLLPIIMNYLGDGYTWRNNGVSLSKLENIKVGKINKSPHINQYYNQLLNILKKRPDIFAEEVN